MLDLVTVILRCYLSFSALKSTLVELVSPRQPLKPTRRERRKPKPQNVHVTSANIVVRVVRAFNVPTRSSPQTVTGSVCACMYIHIYMYMYMYVM